MILDFKEIPKANEGSGLQDTFELFSRDFLEDMGYRIIQDPFRGADGGKDLIVEETRIGVGGKTIIKWLVSCKHNAHSGASVTQDNEPNILDRVVANECEGFFGFYSTISSTSLINILNGLKTKIDYIIFDKEKIEKRLLESVSGNKLAQRYFPLSFKNFIAENPSPADLFTDQESIHCENCGKDLLINKTGIVVFLQTQPVAYNKSIPTKDIYFTCKGECDNILESKYRNKGLYGEGWKDLSNLLIPTSWLFLINTFINTLINGDIYEKKAIDKIQLMFTCSFPYISRNLTTEEKEIAKKFFIISSLGGV